MAEAPKALATGDSVHTPDGKGVVTAIGDRYVDVNLENGQKAIFSHRDIYLDEKLETPATVTPVAPVEQSAPAVEPAETEAPGQ